MNQSISLVLILIALMVLLTACWSENWPCETKKQIELEPLTKEPAVTESLTAECSVPEGAIPLSQQELDELEELFAQELMGESGVMPYTNWYNMAMTSHYESPRQLNLFEFFSEGVGGPDKLTYQPSEEEQSFLQTQEQIYLQLSVYRISKDTMNEVLQQYFGVTLEEMDGVGLDQMAYYPDIDCYYWSKSDVRYVLEFEITDGYRMEDGNIQFFFHIPFREYRMTVKPVEDGYQILSNVWLNDWTEKEN